ncbi:MAG: alpha/beta fold hydrolase [Saprospiraceae bacterium]|nr:alpha/beta fold hydrolase [Saprospiraceae bacterium]
MPRRIVEKMLPYALGRYYNALYRVAPEKAAEKAFALFCTPRGGAIKEKDRPFLERARQSEVKTRSGIRINTYVWPGKSEETVLLLHGWQSNAGRWRRLGPYLEQQGFAVAAIDAPAHGQSGGRIFNAYLYAEAVEAFMKRHSVRYLVGHSVGGMTVSYLVTHFDAPAVQKIVLLGAPSDLTDITNHFNKILRLNENTQEGVRRYFEKRFGNPVSYFSVADFCRRIELPTLVVHDRYDPMAKLQDALRYETALKHGKLLITEHLGHELQDEQVYREIAAFFQGKG